MNTDTTHARMHLHKIEHAQTSTCRLKPQAHVRQQSDYAMRFPLISKLHCSLTIQKDQMTTKKPNLNSIIVPPSTTPHQTISLPFVELTQMEAVREEGCHQLLPCPMCIVDYLVYAIILHFLNLVVQIDTRKACRMTQDSTMRVASLSTSVHEQTKHNQGSNSTTKLLRGKISSSFLHVILLIPHLRPHLPIPSFASSSSRVVHKSLPHFFVKATCAIKNIFPLCPPAPPNKSSSSSSCELYLRNKSNFSQT